MAIGAKFGVASRVLVLVAVTGLGSAVLLGAGSAGMDTSRALPQTAEGPSPVSAQQSKPRIPPNPNVLVADAFDGYAPGSTWADGQRFGPWRVVFTGYGVVGPSDLTAGALKLQPAAAGSPGETHSALVVSRRRLSPSRLRVDARVRTSSQLRQGSAPNPWETAWLVWDYRDNDHFSYLAFKTNGWELGKRDPAYPGGQRFLATGAAPAATTGIWQSVSIRRIVSGQRSTLRVAIDGRSVSRFVDTERPYRSGSVGIYAEDALVEVDSVSAGRA